MPSLNHNRPHRNILRRYPGRSIGAMLLVGLGALEVGGYFQNRTYNIPEDSCVSPFAVSKSYIEPGTSTFFQTQSGVNTTGLIAHGVLPKGAYGVQVAFENPHKQGTDWETSKMIKATAAGEYSVKMAIGSGEVEFGIRVVAAAGSTACDAAPDTVFDHVKASEYATNDAQLPYPNLVSRAVNTATTLF